MKCFRFISHMNHVSVIPTDGNGPTQGQMVHMGYKSKANSHPGQSFSLSLCGPISISRANARMVHMGYKSKALHITPYSVNSFRFTATKYWNTLTDELKSILQE